MEGIQIRPLNKKDRGWLKQFMVDAWGAEKVVSRGIVHEAWLLPGFTASIGGDLAGIVTYNIQDDQCEIVTLDSMIENSGAARANIQAVIDAARSEGCKRLWLITTNDNIHAIRYYQKRGFTIAAIHCNAIEHSRKLKPQIPHIGMEGIPIRDEIEFEMML
ncbi:MAG TPA: GNAT family N-acetyltransferase [candidate division Zixibacteria bacterium]|nr:GNAT family N-acetyltransferase [candidate division Zixibacteria bacterium]HEQ99403.1 GNAT family N-acetyltransferase [candidate division Zixibacteria bacterium]